MKTEKEMAEEVFELCWKGGIEEAFGGGGISFDELPPPHQQIYFDIVRSILKGK